MFTPHEGHKFHKQGKKCITFVDCPYHLHFQSTEGALLYNFLYTTVWFDSFVM